MEKALLPQINAAIGVGVLFVPKVALSLRQRRKQTRNSLIERSSKSGIRVTKLSEITELNC
jgi:hypothetical protein